MNTQTKNTKIKRNRKMNNPNNGDLLMTNENMTTLPKNIQVHGEFDDSKLLAEVSITRNTKINRSTGWKHTATTIQELWADLGRHKVGNKDGPCFLPGKLVGDQRGTEFVEYIDFLVLDVDTGTPTTELIDLIQAKGLMCLVHTTHSHAATRSLVSDNVLRKKYGDEYSDDNVLEYCRDIKRYHPTALNTATVGSKKRIESGIMVPINHEPLAKHRIVFPLKKRFCFADGEPSRSNAITDWKARYLAFGEELGLEIDTSCKDPARVFYFPRHKKGSDWAVHIINGAFLDIDAIDISLNIGDNNRSVRKTRCATEYKTDWLKAFLSRHERAFDAEAFFAKYSKKRSPRSSGVGFHYRCPADYTHSKAGDPTDTGFYSISAFNNEKSRKFHAQCMHDSCSDLKPGNFLDLIIVEHELELKDLEKYCERREGDLLPEGYEYQDGCIWKLFSKKPPVKICGEFHFVGIASNPEGSGHSLIIRIGGLS